MLKGQAKKDYQRRYMRVRRAELKLKMASVRPNVRPNMYATIPQDIDADGNPVCEG